MSRKWVALMLGGLFMAIGFVLAQSYVGREQLVSADRNTCVSYQRNTAVPQINIDREQGRDLSDVRVMDHRIDPLYDAHLNSVDRLIVQALGSRAYSCVVAHPPASILGVRF